MDTKYLLNDYTIVKKCNYKGQLYSVRNNGAVYRHVRSEKSIRELDEAWTFGKYDKSSGFMKIGNDAIHRIVACAYLGEPPCDFYVVSHIDLNRRNNDVKNLRWLPRLANALNHHGIRMEIELKYGKISNFVSNINNIREFAQSNIKYAWMGTVTLDELKITAESLNIREFEEPYNTTTINESNNLNNNELLLETDNGIENTCNDGGLTDEDWRKSGSMFFSESSPYAVHAIQGVSVSPNDEEASSDCNEEEGKDMLTESLTNNALQRRWVTPTEFCLCPKESCVNPIEGYYHNLSKEKVFCKNKYGESVIKDFELSDNKNYLFVSCIVDNIYPKYALSVISFEDGKFVHTNIGKFFSEEGMKKYIIISQGKEWDGDLTFDDLVG